MTRPPMMSSGSGAQALARSLRALSVGTVKAYNDRKTDFEDNAVGEIDQQYQLDLTGVAEPEGVWQDATIMFDAPFINGSEARNAPFMYPMFTFGSVVTKGSRLIVVCNVTSWLTEEQQYVNGCTIEVGMFSSAGGGIDDVVAQLHLNFQGWGAPNPPESDSEAAGSGLINGPQLGV